MESTVAHHHADSSVPTLTSYTWPTHFCQHIKSVEPDLTTVGYRGKNVSQQHTHTTLNQ